MAATISSLTAIGDRRAATNATSLRRVVRFTVPPPQPQGDVCAARDLAFVSPDRTRLVWVFSDPQSATQLAVQPLDSNAARALAGTADARSSFWSLDRRQIGSFADGHLKRLSAEGGPAETLVDATPRGQRGEWTDQDTIVFSPALRSPLHSVSARGGAAAPLATLDTAASEWVHQWPASLFDGKCGR
jgi:hypothetical protein